MRLRGKKIAVYEDHDVEDTNTYVLEPLPNLLFTAAQVCSILNVSRSTWYAMRAEGTAPPSVKIGHKVYVRRCDLEEWISTLPKG